MLTMCQQRLDSLGTVQARGSDEQHPVIRFNFLNNLIDQTTIVERFFNYRIIVWCTPCLIASCDAVSSPRNASIATLAVNSAEYSFL
jgi:hypothetical protein